MYLFVVRLFSFFLYEISLSLNILEYSIYSKREIFHIKKGEQRDRQTHMSAYRVAPQLKITRRTTGARGYYFQASVYQVT